MMFGKTVQELCKIKGWTLSRLSKESSVPLSTLHVYCQGRTPALNHLKKIATALEVSIHRLAFNEPDPHGEISEQVLQEIFSGDVRVTVHRIKRAGRAR